MVKYVITVSELKKKNTEEEKNYCMNMNLHSQSSALDSVE